MSFRIAPDLRRIMQELDRDLADPDYRGDFDRVQAVLRNRHRHADMPPRIPTTGPTEP